MHPSIRLHDLESPASDLARVDALWKESLEERTSAEELLALSLPRAEEYPTGRYILVEDEQGAYVAMAGSVLPGSEARYGFEKRISFPHPSLPVSDRRELGEGLTLYVKPGFRRSGLAYALTFLSMLLCWDAGATSIAAENGAVSLGMASAAGFTNTGIVTMHRKDVPYYLTLGRAEEVLTKTWPAARVALDTCKLSPEVRAIVDRWAASQPSPA